MRREKYGIGLAIFASAFTAAFWSTPMTPAQSGDDKAFERTLDVGLRDVINVGANLFNNQNDHAGCYYLFEGALRSTKPILGKYPELQKKIDVGLAEATKQPRMHDRAHTLRKVLDEIRGTLNPAAKIVAKDKDKASLWDRLGGEKGVDKVLDEFMAAAAADPKVDFFRSGKYAPTPDQVKALKKSLLDLVSAVSGGPYQYKGGSMKDVHKGMGITDDQFSALAGHLKTTLEKNGVKSDDVKMVLAVVGNTRSDIVEGPGKKVEVIIPPKKQAEDTLWNRLGGEKGVDKVLTDFIAAAATDPKVDFTRGGKYKVVPADLKKSLLDLVSTVAEGPYLYKGGKMSDVHKGMGITNEQFDALARHLKTALEKNGVKADDVRLVLSVIDVTRDDIVEAPIKKNEANVNQQVKKVELPDPNMAQVNGKVTIGGQMLTHGYVTFVTAAGQRFSANVQKDGTFVFRKGFPPGEYVVLLEETPTKATAAEKRLVIPLQFSEATLSPLRYTASKGPNTFNVEVK